MRMATSARSTYEADIRALIKALEADDEHALIVGLERLTQVRESERSRELLRLSSELRAALDRFALDPRVAVLAAHEVPGARQRLDHVLRLTDEAAHRTLELVEKSFPLAERVEQGARRIQPLWQAFRARTISVPEYRTLLDYLDDFLGSSCADAELVRGNLGGVLLAQGYQDISGQIIRGVMVLVDELETVLVELVRLGRQSSPAQDLPASNAAEAVKSSAGFGPVVPGIDHGSAVAGQQDVDSLLSGLGL